VAGARSPISSAGEAFFQLFLREPPWSILHGTVRGREGRGLGCVALYTATSTKKGVCFEVKSAPFEGTPTSQVGRARGRFSAFPPQHLNEGWFRGVQTHARRRLRPRWPLGREKCARGPLDNSRGAGRCVAWRDRTAFWFRLRSHMVPKHT